MRLKDGKQACPKCQGQGCYWCRRRGWVVQCPACMNHEPELVDKDADEFTCLACGASFDPAGAVLDTAKPTPKPTPKRV